MSTEIANTESTEAAASTGTGTGTGTALTPMVSTRMQNAAKAYHTVQVESEGKLLVFRDEVAEEVTRLGITDRKVAGLLLKTSIIAALAPDAPAAEQEDVANNFFPGSEKTRFWAFVYPADGAALAELTKCREFNRKVPKSSPLRAKIGLRHMYPVALGTLTFERLKAWKDGTATDPLLKPDDKSTARLPDGPKTDKAPDSTTTDGQKATDEKKDTPATDATTAAGTTDPQKAPVSGPTAADLEAMGWREYVDTTLTRLLANACDRKGADPTELAEYVRTVVLKAFIEGRTVSK